MPNRVLRLATAALLLALIAGCSGLGSLRPQPPTVEVAGLRVAALNFNYADLVVDLRVDNPNAVALKLAGFDYRATVDGQRVLQGEQRRRLELAAADSTLVPVPVRLSFGDVAGVIGSLANRDRIDYELDVGLDVDIPVLGTRRVTAHTADSLPIPQRPGIELRALRVTRLGVSGVGAEAVLGIHNPNGFALTLDRLEWNLDIEGSPLAEGGTTAPLRVGPNGTGQLTLKLDLDANEISHSLFNFLASTGPAGYRLNALLSATAGDGRLGTFEVPLQRSGRVTIR